MAGALCTAFMRLLRPVAYWHSGWDIGLLAVRPCPRPFASSAALAALVLNDHFREPSRALHGLVFSMAARTGLPLILAVAVHFQDGTLGKAGLLYYLVVFYLISLGIEMPLSLIRTPSRASPRRRMQGPKPRRKGQYQETL